MFKKTFAIAVLAAASAGATMAQTYTIVRVAPPAPIVETVPAPRAGYVWAPGYYDYRGGNYVWVQGHWERNRPGYEWREARWVQTGNGEWRRVGNNWERGPYGDRDHDGIANKDDGYNNNRQALRPNRDQDGDGIRNRDDRYPYNPRRS